MADIVQMKQMARLFPGDEKHAAVFTTQRNSGRKFWKNYPNSGAPSRSPTSFDFMGSSLSATKLFTSESASTKSKEGMSSPNCESCPRLAGNTAIPGIQGEFCPENAIFQNDLPPWRPVRSWGTGKEIPS